MTRVSASPKSAGFPQGFFLVLPSTLTVMGSVVLAPVLPQLMEVFSDVPNKAFWVPALLTVPGLCFGLFAPLFGLAGDRWGRRNLLIASTSAYFLVGMAPLILGNFTSIFLSRIALGITEAGVLVLSTALVGDYFTGPTRDRWLASQTVVATLSALVLLPIGGVMGAWLGWRGPFYIYVLALPLAIALWRLTWETPAEVSEENGSWAMIPWGWLIAVCGISIITSVLFYAVQLQIGLAFSAIGIVDSARIGLLSAIATAGVPVGALLFWTISQVRLERLLAGEFFLAGVTLIALGHVTSATALVAIAFLNLVACGLMLPTLLTNVARRMEKSVRARGVGIWQACFSVGQFVSVGATAAVSAIRPGATILDAFQVLGFISIGTCLLVAMFIAFTMRGSLSPASQDA